MAKLKRFYYQSLVACRNGLIKLFNAGSLEYWFNQYVPIHCSRYCKQTQDLLLQVTGDGYAMISSDFFTFGGGYDDVKAALKEAVQNNTVLVNQEG